MVEFDTGEDWLIDWNTELLLPTQPHPDQEALSSSSLVITSMETDLLDCINYQLLSMISLNLPLTPPSNTASPPALPQLFSCSPSSFPVLPCSTVKPQNQYSPASPNHADPFAQPPASDPLIPPRSVSLSASPWLLLPLACSSTRFPRPSGSPLVSRHPCATDL